MHTFVGKPKATQRITSPKAEIRTSSHFGRNHDVSPILHIQHAIGNQAVPPKSDDIEAVSNATAAGHFGHDFSRIPMHASRHCNIQPRLSVGAPGVKYEQRVEPVQRMVEEEEPLQGKFIASEATAHSQGNVSEAENRTGLPIPLRVGLEQLSGMDLSGVRVHTNSPKPAQINALAYTKGKDIHLSQGQEKHLPHEGWHVVQQMQGRVNPTIQAMGTPINDDDQLEREADVMGARALQQAIFNRNQSLRLALNYRTAGPSVVPTTKPVVQRSMKFEFQVSKNKIFRDDGDHTIPLPRKYGPEDFLVKGSSGVRLESESHGQIEFETSWKRKWSKLGAQIREAQQMVEKMKKEPADVTGSDGNKYKKFPFPEAQIKHLRPKQGFRMSGSNVWSKSQKSGWYESNKETHYAQAKVIPDNLDVRKRPNEKSKAVGALSKSDIVIVLKSQKGWSKVKKGNLTGWVATDQIQPFRFGQWIPSGKDTNPLLSVDTILDPKEELLVKETDSKWQAGIQSSESFELAQYESFLEQHEWPSYKSSTIASVDKIMSALNTKGIPAEELVNLRNFLLIIINYIERGRGGERSKERGAFEDVKGMPSKQAFTLMSRTNFASMRNRLLSKKEKVLFKKLATSKSLMKSFGLDPDSRVFVKGYGANHPGPTIFQWLNGIHNGKDYLSVQRGKGLSASMGRFNVDMAEGHEHSGLVRFETRNRPLSAGGAFRDAADWFKYAHELFMFAMKNRKRASGKGETGLKLK